MNIERLKYIGKNIGIILMTILFFSAILPLHGELNFSYVLKLNSYSLLGLFDFLSSLGGLSYFIYSDLDILLILGNYFLLILFYYFTYNIKNQFLINIFTVFYIIIAIVIGYFFQAVVFAT